MVVGPKWQGPTPAGVAKVFRASTDFSLVIFRTQLFSPEDLPNVKAVQAGYKVQALSEYLGKAPPPAAPKVEWPVIDPALLKARFFEYLDLVMDFAPPGPEEAAIRAKLARLGVGTSGRFEMAALSSEL
jgi:hypothetical protein